MANAMDPETLSMKREFLSTTDDGGTGEELNTELELSLDLSLGGSIGKAKERKREDPKSHSNLQPCLIKLASGSLDIEGVKTSTGGKPLMQEIWKNLQSDKASSGSSTPSPLSKCLSGTGALVLPNGSNHNVKASWPREFISASTSSKVQDGTGHCRILRTCSVGALRTGFMAPPAASVLNRHPSLDELLADRKQEVVQSIMQKEILEQQRKREVHAMRRQQARRKREEKQQKKARRDEGNSFPDSKDFTCLPVSSCSTITSSNTWMLNPESVTNPTNQTRTEGKLLLETQRSLQRNKDRAAKENEKWIETKKRIKKKGGGNGSMVPFPGESGIGATHGALYPAETSNYMDNKANSNHSASARNSNSSIKRESGSEEKNSKELCENEHKTSSSNGEEGQSVSSRSRSINCETSASYAAPAFPVISIPYPFPVAGANGQCMPLPIGPSFPYLMPCWQPTTQPSGSESSKSNVPSVSYPVSAHSLPPSFKMTIPGTPPNWLSLPQHKGTPAQVPVQNSHASEGSLRRSSSPVNQDNKSSDEISSNEMKSQSKKSAKPSLKGSRSLARVPSVNKSQCQDLSFSEISASSKTGLSGCREAIEKISCTPAQELPSSKISQEKPPEAPCKRSSHFVSDSNKKEEYSDSRDTLAHDSDGPVKQTTKDLNNETLDQNNNSNLKPGMSCSQLFEGNGLLSTLHWVTTTGVGPNGITISGILSSYSSNEVRIVCICHGTQMSPAEFVQHAGSTDISNPERNIVVTAIPVGIPATSAQG